MRRALKIFGAVVGLVLVGVGGLATYVYATALEPAKPVGFQRMSVADPGHPAIAAAVWYPTAVKPGFVLLGSSGFRLAADAPVEGGRLPLILFSHGTGASAFSHADTAIALAERGFVVVAPTHPGDNFQDGSNVGKPDWLANRSRHVQRTLDAALTRWKDRGHIDPERIGIFGFSAGATTALITVGGEPDLQRISSHCARRPEFVCRVTAPEASRNVGPVDWQADARVRAAVLAAPGLGFTFTEDGLAGVQAPVQLWAGSADQTVPFATNAGMLRDLLGRKAEMRLVPNGGHFSFLMPCGLLAPRDLCRDSEGFDRTAFHDQFNDAVADFFEAKLAGPQRTSPQAGR